MEDRKVPWWRKAISFALNGFRSGFGLFSRTQKNGIENEPEHVAGEKDIPEEEIELIKNSPELEAISEAETESVAVIAVDAAGSLEADVQADEANVASPELGRVSEVTTGPEIEPEVEVATEEAGAIEVAPESRHEEMDAPETIALQEPVDGAIAAESSTDIEIGGPEMEGATEAAIEPVVAHETDASRIEAVEEALLGPVVALETEIIGAQAEEIQAQPAGQPDPVEHESVDEATLEAETPVNVDPLPEPAEQPMDLKNSISEQDAAAEYAQPSDATNEAASRDREPEGEAVVEFAAAADVAHEDASEPSVAIESSDRGEEEAAMETPEVVGAIAAGAQAVADNEAEPSAISTQKAAAPQHPSKPFIKLESRENEADQSAFSVIVSQVYDGPLDLLLDLIRKQDIDIYDIPIARITAQFLAYVNQLKATDVDVAGEFIYTASLLIHIKSKMLLPRAPAGPDDAAEDPRRELVERLLEHERFKNAAQMLQQKQMLEAASWTNPGIREFQDDASAEPEIAADTVDLVRVFRDILDRARNRPVINVEEDSVTVGQMIQFLARRLTMEDKPVALRRLLSHTRSERALIAMFLALLELVRLQAILLRQDRAFSEIFIKKHTGFEAVMDEGMANARDDWR